MLLSPLRHKLYPFLFSLICVPLLSLSAIAQESASPDSGAAESESKSIEWHTYEEGVRLAQEKNKHVLIDFSTKWCGFCKKMDRETFTDQKVINYINNHFVAVKVDGDSPREINLDGFKTSEKQITKEVYGVRGYPTFWFLESDGSKVGQQPGYQPPKDFLALLEFVKERKYEKPNDANNASNRSQGGR